MTEVNTTTPEFVYVKIEKSNGSLEIARHSRPVLLDASDDLATFVRDIVLTYKTDPSVTYLGLADEEEYAAFNKLQDGGARL